MGERSMGTPCIFSMKLRLRVPFDRKLLGMYLGVSRGKVFQVFDRELLEMYRGVEHFRSLIGNSWGCI